MLQRINAYDQKVAGLEQKLRGTRLRNILTGLNGGK
jgi:hypothetical protein